MNSVEWLAKILSGGAKKPADVIPIRPDLPATPEAPWMAWVEARLGWSEKTHNDELAKGWKYAGHSKWDSIVGRDRAWCAMFVNFALHETGFRGNGRADAKSFIKYGIPCEDKYGAILVIQHPSGRHHVTFRGRKGLCGGNQDNQVSDVPMAKGDKVVAIRWPGRA